MGILYILVAILSGSSRAVFIKKKTAGLSELFVVWGSMGAAALLFLPILLKNPVPWNNFDFSLNLGIVTLINSLTMILTLKALKKGELSVVEPLRIFVPFFMFFTGPLLLHEQPSPLGFAGIFLILIGSWIAEKGWKGILHPIQTLLSLLNRPGARLMLLNTVLWSISSCLAKRAVLVSSPLVFTAWFHLSVFILFNFFGGAFLFGKQKIFRNLNASKFMWIIVIGILGASVHFFVNMAFAQMLAVYVIAVKRLDLIVSVLFGYFFFKEKNVQQKLQGAVVMILGGVLVLLGLR